LPAKTSCSRTVGIGEAVADLPRIQGRLESRDRKTRRHKKGYFFARLGILTRLHSLKMSLSLNAAIWDPTDLLLRTPAYAD